MEYIFTNIYKKKYWGDNKNNKYNGSSGDGSKLEYNINTYIPFLKEFITKNNIKTIVDLGCGDFICGSYIYNELNIKYTGYDVYKEIIEYNSYIYPSQKYNFLHLDFYSNKEKIITGDLCIIKDVLHHWPLLHIYNFLDYLVDSKKFKYILICNCSENPYQETCNDVDIPLGSFRPLSSNFLPLKKYNPIIVYKYDTKEVSVITV